MQYQLFLDNGELLIIGSNVELVHINSNIDKISMLEDMRESLLIRQSLLSNAHFEVTELATSESLYKLEEFFHISIIKIEIEDKKTTETKDVSIFICQPEEGLINDTTVHAFAIMYEEGQAKVIGQGYGVLNEDLLDLDLKIDLFSQELKVKIHYEEDETRDFNSVSGLYDITIANFMPSAQCDAFFHALNINNFELAQKIIDDEELDMDQSNVLSHVLKRVFEAGAEIDVPQGTADEGIVYVDDVNDDASMYAEFFEYLEDLGYYIKDGKYYGPAVLSLKGFRTTDDYDILIATFTPIIDKEELFDRYKEYEMEKLIHLTHTSLIFKYEQGTLTYLGIGSGVTAHHENGFKDDRIFGSAEITIDAVETVLNYTSVDLEFLSDELEHIQTEEPFSVYQSSIETEFDTSQSVFLDSKLEEDDIYPYDLPISSFDPTQRVFGSGLDKTTLMLHNCLIENYHFQKQSDRISGVNVELKNFVIINQETGEETSAYLSFFYPHGQAIPVTFSVEEEVYANEDNLTIDDITGLDGLQSIQSLFEVRLIVKKDGKLQVIGDSVSARGFHPDKLEYTDHYAGTGNFTFEGFEYEFSYNESSVFIAPINSNTPVLGYTTPVDINLGEPDFQTEIRKRRRKLE